MEKNITAKTVLLTPEQIEQRINTLAYRIYEDNISEEEIVIAGITKTGFQLAERISSVLRNISQVKIQTISVTLEKHSASPEVTLSGSKDVIRGKAIILVDDVLNSGKTMLFALKPFLDTDIKKIRTVVLIDRDHKSFPVAADFAGLTLSTTLKEHVTVELNGSASGAWLS